MISGEIFVGEFFEFKSTATNVRKWDRTSVPTGHLRTQNGSNLRPKFGLSIRIRIEDETILSPISVRIRIGHSTAYTRVLDLLYLIRIQQQQQPPPPPTRWCCSGRLSSSGPSTVVVSVIASSVPLGCPSEVPYTH
jgi:hypothetical protein